MFETITPANWTMFAMRHYDNPQADGEEEFYEDIKRFKYLKRLFKKYYDTGNLKERLIPVSYTHLTLPTTPYV